MAFVYDEAKTVETLAGLDASFQAAFALACAGRVLPNYRVFAERSDFGDAAKLEALYERAWQDLLGTPMTTEELLSGAAEAESLVPPKATGDKEYAPYAKSAAAAIALALHARVDGDGRGAEAAARRVYRAADEAVGRLIGRGSPGEAEVLGHIIVQRELERQARDVAELGQMAGLSDATVQLSAMKQRSAAEAGSFFEGELGA